MKDKKIYIVLTQTYTGLARLIKLFTNNTYSHASIAFDEKCNEMYSFGRKYDYILYGIFKKENLKEGLFRRKNSLIAIYEIEVTSYQYKKIKEKIEYIKNTNKGYNIIGLILANFKIKLHRNKYYCSEFVYEVLSSEGVNIFDNKKILFTPEDLINHSNFNKIYEGRIKDFILEF